MRILGIIGMLIGLCWANSSPANVVITGTRVVYPSQNKEIGIELNNVGDSPALVQAWISNADDDRNTATPFVLTPPIFRMDGNKKQTLRVIYTHEPLAKDKETLFYFNLLDIPPMPDASDAQNYLQFSLLSKLKFFYRPKNLKPSIDKAYQHLTAQQTTSELVVHNPTPYYMTLSNIELFAKKDDQTALAQTDKTPMIEPFGKASIALYAPNAQFAKLELINDYGGKVGVFTSLNTQSTHKK